MTVAAADFTDLDQRALEWLLECPEPGIRIQARHDLLGDDAPADDIPVSEGPWMRALLAGQQADGGFDAHPYKKWNGAHWRLVSMVELGIPAGEPRAVAAAETVLDWLTGQVHRSRIKTINGRTRRCASQEGNALAVACRLGLADDARTRLLAESLVGWQWADGGWNCDRTPGATHSSVHESLAPTWGLSEFARAAGHPDAAAAAQRAVEFFLDHRLFRSHMTGEVGDRRWLQSPYPAYWHYNSVQGLTILARVGGLPDSRADEAIRLLRGRQQPDGLWHVGGSQYWRHSGPLYWDPVPWERSGPSYMLTLNALRVLRTGA